MTTQDLSLASDFDTATREQWLALVDKALKGGDFERRLVSKTEDGVRIEPLYRRGDALPGRDTELPGAEPFTRGMSPMREGLGWDIRQFHSGTDPDAVSREILEDLEGGANSIALHVAGPGTSGLPATKDAITKALSTVLLDYAGVSFVAGENTGLCADALAALWDAKGIAASERRGHFNSSPLGVLAGTGHLSEPIGASYKECARLVRAAHGLPRVTALLADGVTFHNGGATAGQELAAMLSTLTAYLRALEADGIAPSDAIPKIALSVAADTDQFLTMVKLRAARRLVWRVAEACGAGEHASSIHLSAVTSWRMLAKRDPWTNILRSTIATAGAAIGGADAITVLPFTYALGQTDSFARRVSRNIQIVLQEESNLARVIDPAGGSWYFEKLTDELAQKAWAQFQEFEAKGGMLAALQSGFVQDTIAQAAATRRTAAAQGYVEMTGVSAFPLLGEDGVTAEPWPAATPPPQNPALAVRRLEGQRIAQPFEDLRDKADQFAAKSGGPATVFLASIGKVIDHTQRSTWVQNYLAAAGIKALTTDGYADANEAAAAFSTSGAKCACICSSDTLYAEHAEAVAMSLKAAGADLVLMAGRPGDAEAALQSAGVDQFLFAGADAVEVLSGLQAKLGIS